MHMSDPVLKLQLLARAELTLAQIHARRVGTRSTYFAVALVFLLLGLAMATLAAYHALVPAFGPALAALVVALVDAGIAIVIALLARHAGPAESEESLAREMRDMAYAEIGRDIEEVKNNLEQIGTEIKRIRSGFSALTSGAASSLGPLLGVLTKVVKRD